MSSVACATIHGDLDVYRPPSSPAVSRKEKEQHTYRPATRAIPPNDLKVRSAIVCISRPVAAQCCTLLCDGSIIKEGNSELIKKCFVWSNLRGKVLLLSQLTLSA